MGSPVGASPGGHLLPNQPGSPGEMGIMDTTRPPLKLLGVAERCEKVRMASLHPPEEVHVARTLTATLLQALELAVPQSRAMLKGRVPRTVRRLINGLMAESTDLKAATDEMGTELTREVLDSCLRALKAPGWAHRAARIIGGPHRIVPSEEGVHPGGITTTGAFMGLGPSWVALSLVNAYCLEAAGIPPRSAVVCGDDAFALATRRELLRYHKLMTSLGLRINKEKSYVSRVARRGVNKSFGVFCERTAQFKELRSSTSQAKRLVEARFVDEVRLAEAMGLTVADRPTGVDNSGWMVVENLTMPLPKGRHRHRLVTRLALYTARQLAFGKTGGPLSLGGGGVGQVTADSVRQLLTIGATRPPRIKSTKWSRSVASTVAAAADECKDHMVVRNRRARDEPLPAGCRLRSDILREVAVEAEVRALYAAGGKPKPKMVGRGVVKSYRKKLKSNFHKHKAVSIIDLTRTEWATKQYSAPTLEKVRHYLRRSNYRRAARTLASDDFFVNLPSSDFLTKILDRAHCQVDKSTLEGGTLTPGMWT